MKIKATRLSDVIVEKLENMILEGIYEPGQKLPPERELAGFFEVSRPSLREAIQSLEAKGLIIRRQGGGNFVSPELAGGFSDPLFQLLSQHPESQYDLLEFRHALEGISAYYAALRSTESDIAQITQKFELVQQSREANDLAKEASAIQQFWLGVVEASHNVVLLHLVRSMAGLLEQNILQNLQMLEQRDDIRDILMQHRNKILDAIVAGEPEQARLASNAHLAFIEDKLLDISKENSRVERSLRRVQSVGRQSDK